MVVSSGSGCSRGSRGSSGSDSGSNRRIRRGSKRRNSGF